MTEKLTRWTLKRAFDFSVIPDCDPQFEYALARGDILSVCEDDDRYVEVGDFASEVDNGGGDACVYVGWRQPDMELLRAVHRFLGKVEFMGGGICVYDQTTGWRLDAWGGSGVDQWGWKGPVWGLLGRTVPEFMMADWADTHDVHLLWWDGERLHEVPRKALALKAPGDKEAAR